MKRLVLPAALVLSLLGIAAAIFTGYNWLWGTESEWRAAQEAAKRHDYAVADQHLRRYLAARPDKAEAHLLAAQIERRAIQPSLEGEEDEQHEERVAADSTLPKVGSYVEAERHLREYKRLGGVPELIEMERTLTLAQRGDLEEVEPLLDAWLKEKHPETPLILEALMKGYLINYRLADVDRCLEQLIKLDESLQCLFVRAWMAYRGQDYDGVVAAYRRILELDPDNEEAEMQLASVLKLSSKLREAMPHFQRLHQKRPADFALNFGIAETYLLLNDTAEARKIVDRLLAEDPDTPETIYLLAKLESKAGNHAKAEELVRKSLAKKPWLRQPLILLCECLGREPPTTSLPALAATTVGLLGSPMGEGPFLTASSLVAEAAQNVARKVEIAKARTTLDAIEYGHHRLDEVTRQIVRSPKRAILRWEVGAIHIGSKQTKTGISWLRTALRADPQHQPTLRLLKEYEEVQEDVRDGKQDLSGLRRSAHQALAEHYKPMGEPRFKVLAEFHADAAKQLGADGSASSKKDSPK